MVLFWFFENFCSFLIEHGANVHASKQRGTSPLYFASRKNHLRIVQVSVFLCQHCFCDSWETQLLIEHGASVNAAKSTGTSPIFIACQEGHLEMVKLLEKNGADGASGENEMSLI